jgi:hypothetical protein
MKPCRACEADDWGICAYHESVAEDRAHGVYVDTGSSDREADRFERWVLGL